MSMAGWGGFSEEDLHRLKKDHLQSDEVPEEKPENLRKVNINPGPKRQKPREKIKSKATATKKDPNAKQEKVVQKKTTCEDSSVSCSDSTPECERSFTAPKVNETEKEDKFAVTENGTNNQDEEEKVPDIIVEPERIQAIELNALEKMQQKQKEIEDQNKKKKAALQETIRTRFRKTQAEANTLKYVHKELAHLDNLLSADVAVLRDTIEEATRDYHYAMKRYEHSEAEFVSAKIDLHKKTERKEKLTEHLLAIIQQNEERKAKKLEELMAKLDVSEEALEEESLKQQSQHNVTGNKSVEKGNEMDEKKILPENMEKADEHGKITESENSVKEDKSEVNENSNVKEEKEQNGKVDHASIPVDI